MAKIKTKGGVNKHLQARVSYLHEAAVFLSQSKNIVERNTIDEQNNKSTTVNATIDSDFGPAIHSIDTGQKASIADPRYLMNQLRGVSRRAQIRVSSVVKQASCKRCDTLLMPASTSQATVENTSKEGRKPWADVRVVKCLNCGTEKRQPVGAKRQKGKKGRELTELNQKMGGQREFAEMNQKIDGQEGFPKDASLAPAESSAMAHDAS